jgi:hypothetical protein
MRRSANYIAVVTAALLSVWGLSTAAEVEGNSGPR